MAADEPDLPPGGWYADPEGEAGRQRYWDGERWTERYHSGGSPSPAGAEEKRFGALRTIAGVFYVLGWVVAILGGLGVIAGAIAAGGAEDSSDVFGNREASDASPVAVLIVGGIAVFIYSLLFFAAAGFIRLMLAIEESSRRTAAAVERFAGPAGPG